MSDTKVSTIVAIYSGKATRYDDGGDIGKHLNKGDSVKINGRKRPIIGKTYDFDSHAYVLTVM